MEKLKPTNDFLFKKIFGEKKNSDLLKNLLQSILTNIQIKKVIINTDVSLERKHMQDKLGILDIVATLNDDTIVNIEMQVKDYKNTVERALFYESGLYYNSLEAGDDYTEIPRSISIWITKFDIFEDGPFHERARLKRDYENIILTNRLEMHFIQLSKFKRKCKRISNELEEWLTFILNDNLEAIKMIDNEYVQKAEEEFEYLTGDAETRRLAELREKALRDEDAAIKNAKRRGIEEGYKSGFEQGEKRGIEQGTKKGFEQGEKRGFEQGTKKGIKENSIDIAKKMLAKKIDINTIVEITGLTKEEIENLN